MRSVTVTLLKVILLHGCSHFTWALPASQKKQPIQTMIDPFILPKKYEIVLVLVFKINPK